MYKTPAKHKRIAHKYYRTAKNDLQNDVDRIKAYLWETTQNVKNTAEDKFNESIDSVKDQSLKVQGFVKKKPVKAIGISLATGILTGMFISYFINHR